MAKLQKALKSQPEVEKELLAAMDHFFMGETTFLEAFNRSPVEALQLLKTAPETFGHLRTYVGKLSLNRKHTVVLSAARRLAKLRG